MAPGGNLGIVVGVDVELVGALAVGGPNDLGGFLGAGIEVVDEEPEAGSVAGSCLYRFVSGLCDSSGPGLYALLGLSVCGFG